MTASPPIPQPAVDPPGRTTGGRSVRWRRLIRRRMPWRLWAPLAMLSLLPFGYAYARYQVGIDPQVHRCLPGFHGLAVIDTWDRTVERGRLYAFKSHGLAPIWPDGQTVVKFLVGVPGDRVVVGTDSTTVNGRTVGEGLLVAATLHVAPERFARSLVLEPGHYWAMGRTEDSLDSRYWGTIAAGQVLGRAYLVW